MKFVLMKIRLNKGGYTDRGDYFGVGLPLYKYRHDKWTHGGEVTSPVSDFLRAENREDAKRQIRAKWPEATFYGDKNPSKSILTPQKIADAASDFYDATARRSDMEDCDVPGCTLRGMHAHLMTNVERRDIEPAIHMTMEQWRAIDSILSEDTLAMFAEGGYSIEVINALTDFLDKLAKLIK